MRILVVDDYAPFANSVRLMLRDHRVELARSGREALELLERDGDFDALLLDVGLPELTGLEVYEHLRRHAPEASARVIFLTGGAKTVQEGEQLAALSNPSLEKPFREVQLRAALAEIAAR